MPDQGTNPDRVIARIAARQHGVVSSAQLAAAGLNRSAISYRAKAGRLHRLHRGVYAVGHPRVGFEGRCLAAVLACGEGAVASHRSAAAIWDLLPPSPGKVHVTVPIGGGHKRRKGLSVHRSRTLTDSETRRHRGVPVTRPLRTLVDLRRTESRELHQRAARRALDLRLVTEGELGREPDLTRSELERRFLRLCRRHRLPGPEVNTHVGRYEVDFLWRSPRLIAETDGFRHHGSRTAFEADRARDAELLAAGFTVVRFTYRQIEASPDAVADRLRRLLRSE